MVELIVQTNLAMRILQLESKQLRDDGSEDDDLDTTDSWLA